MTNRRLALQGNSLGIEPEMVLVLETNGSIENFLRAVKRVKGLEWLGEYEIENIEPNDGFEHASDPKKTFNGQLFLVMSDTRALAELRGLFNSWRKNTELPFRRGLAPLRHAFEHLHDIRPWDSEDRLRHTGVLENWKDRIESGQEIVSFEVELWYRENVERRQLAERQIEEFLTELGGNIVNRCVINEVAYHAILGCIDITRVSELLDQPATWAEVKLFQCDDIMFLRPLGHCAIPIGEDSKETYTLEPSEAAEKVEGAPIVALLDGMPMTGHLRLKDRVVVDDPDGFEAAYQATERSHGTAMASLICHGDFDQNQKAISRPLYVRPIMKPIRYFTGNFVEVIPEDELPVDLIYRAVVRLFEGDGDESPTSPSIRVINLSIGDPVRPFIREISSWARILDWLSWKFNVLFVVSAGNHTQTIDLAASAPSLRGLHVQERQELIIAALAKDTRNRRLLPPAETLNGLTVGAAHEDGSVAVSNHLIDPMDWGLPSVISAHGPGYNRAIKPEILMPGGRQQLTPQMVTSDDKTVLDIDRSYQPPGQRVATPGQAGMLDGTRYTRGTSNATALASREGCFLFELLETLREQPHNSIPIEFDAVLIKTLLVHGSNWDGMIYPYDSALGETHSGNFREYVSRFLGYGRPDFERVISGGEQRVTLLGFGKLEDGKAAEFILPVPPSLSLSPLNSRITISLAWMSTTNTRSLRYRVAHLWFSIRGTIANTEDRIYADGRATQRGTVQHEIFEIPPPADVMVDEQIVVKVNCRSDAGDIIEPVRFGLALTLEIQEHGLLTIPIYEEVSQRIQIRPRPTVGAS